MALRDCQSWDCSSSLPSPWEAISGEVDIVNSTSRTGAQCAKVGGIWDSGLVAAFDAQSTWIVGAAYKTSGGTIHRGIFYLADGSNYQLKLSRDAYTGQLSVLRSDVYDGAFQGTILATSTESLAADTWAYVEFRGTINSTTGSFEVRVNGETWLSGSGYNTQHTGNPYANRIILGIGFSYYDDVYVCDTNGAANSDFLGDIKVEALRPTGAGANTDLAASSGANYECVDELLNDGDTTYVYSGTVGNIDTYAYGNPSAATGSVKAVKWFGNARKDDAGTRKITPVYRHGGTDYYGSEVSLSMDYTYYPEISEANPGTSLPWTIDDVTNAEFGVEVTT